MGIKGTHLTPHDLWYGMGTVWEIPTCGLPILNPKQWQWQLQQHHNNSDSPSHEYEQG